MWTLAVLYARIILATLAYLLLSLSIAHGFEQQSKPCAEFDWKQLPSNQWIQLPTCNHSPPKVFHGASALASDRSTVFFFGADTHEKDYDNSVYRLSLKNLNWSQDYHADPLDTYRVTPQGYPVTTTNRPWAMHSFDGWDYDPVHKMLVLTGSPTHATRAIQQLKAQGKLTHPIQPTTWHYNPYTHAWKFIQTSSPNLFAGGFAWNPALREFIGHDGHQTYHYEPQQQKWETYSSGSVPGYHLRLTFDTLTHTILSLGNNQNSHDLWSYSSTSAQWHQIKVPEPPLPANGAAIAYNSRHHVLVYLANDSSAPYHNPSGKSVTFIYSSRNHRWIQLPIKSPPLYGMNYLTQYDEISDVVLHFEKSSADNDHMSLWVFRYQPS